MILVDDPEAEAYGVEIEVLRYGMMMVLGPRRVPITGSIGRRVGMIGVRMVRRMRFRMTAINVPMRRDLKQVANGQGQDYARRKHTWDSGKHSCHDLRKLTPEARFVNLGKPGTPCWRIPMLWSRPHQARATVPVDMPQGSTVRCIAL